MSDNVIKWMNEIQDIKEKAIDPLAAEVMRRFNGAIAWQTTERVNGKPLRDVLNECWEQQNGILDCNAKELAEAMGADVVVNLTALKTGVANAYLTEAMTAGDASLPWTIQPTPRPDISPAAKDAILQELKEALFTGGVQDGEQMVELIRMAKMRLRSQEHDKAEKAAKEMMYLIEDQCAEGGFARAITDFLQYFPVYPYAVFTGPYITRAPRLTWGKNKPRFITEVFPTFRAVSPFDFCYSPDSPDTQRGTCVFTRTTWTRKQLLDACKLPSYLGDNILEVLEQADNDVHFDLDWLSKEPEAPSRDVALWSSNTSPIEVLTHYGIMSGRELAQYNVTGLDDNEFYNCEIAMTGYRVIQVRVNSDPHLQKRPVYTASFYRTNGDRIAGDGIAQRLRDIERAYHACLMYLMRNAANASAPICEADYRRVSKYLSDDDLGKIIPGTMYLTDSDGASGSNPALKFTNIPSNLQGYEQLLTMFMQLADRVTNIPASLHGEAVGSGAMRTFRGMSMLQGNATKALHAAVGNIASGVFNDLGELLYNMNMLYSEDAAVKGDSKIITKGAEGILAKELDKQSAMEILQVIAQTGSAMQGAGLNLGPVLGWSFKKLFGAMGIPDDVLKMMEMPAPQQMMQAQETASGGGMAGGNPNSNPAPAGEGQGVAEDTEGLGAY